MKTPIEYHPAADIFPLMDGEAFQALLGDIRDRGQIEPIWTHDGKIIDGRNRFRACQELGIDPLIREWDGRGDLIAFIVSLNLHRRHLTESQRSMVAARIMPIYEEEARKRQSHGQTAPGRTLVANLRQALPGQLDEGRKSSTRAASVAKVSPRSVQSAAKVIREGVPELAAAVDAGKVRVSAAAKIAEMTKAEQARVVAQGPAAIRQHAAAIRKRRLEDDTPAYEDESQEEPGGEEIPPAKALTRVNGHVRPDPPDIARARASGKIAADIEVEITEPENRNPPLGDEAEPAESLDDAAWLLTLPARASLGAHSLLMFDRDALAYRTMVPGREAFRKASRSTLKAADRKGTLPPYLHRLRSFLKINDPRHWIVCPPTDKGGCGGTGTVGVLGNCPKCHGSGYMI